MNELSINTYRKTTIFVMNNARVHTRMTVSRLIRQKDFAVFMPLTYSQDPLK